MKRLLWTVLLTISLAALVMGQITGPSAVDYSGGAYQVTADNVSGTVMANYGWNLSKKAYLIRPARAVVRVDSVSGPFVYWWYEINYLGRVDTVTTATTKATAFWVPVDATNIPDSLFYIVPDTTGMAAGDEFVIRNDKVQPGGQYNFRLLYATDTIKGTATQLSQPVWIGDGVSTITFAFDPADSVAVVYRALYATSIGGPYLWYASTDTLADSAWTADSVTPGAWNYTAGSGIDLSRWLKVERIGQVAADTVKINGEILFIKSN